MEGDMAVDAKGYFLAKSKQNGATYRIGVSLYEKHPMDWEPIVEKVHGEGEMDYFDLKSKLIELGVDFKGNAKKDELLKLYEEATSR